MTENTLPATDGRVAALDGALAAIRAEALKAMGKFATFNSPHEGWAVIREEVDELWDEVKGNNLSRQLEEVVQVGAMAARYMVDLTPDDGGWSLPDGYDADSYDADDQR
jgi:hypothetical protein